MPIVGKLDYSRKAAAAHEEREAALLVENANIRQALALLTRELIDTINGQPLHGQPMPERMQLVLDVDGAGGDDALLRQMEMPFDVVESDIQLALRDKLSALRERIQQAGPSPGKGAAVGAAARWCDTAGGGAGAVDVRDLHLEIERLEGQLAEAQRSLQEQERLVSAYLHHCSHVQPVRWENASPAATADGEGGRAIGGEGLTNGSSGGGPLVAADVSSGCREESRAIGMGAGSASGAARSEPPMGARTSPGDSKGAGYSGRRGAGWEGAADGGGSQGGVARGQITEPVQGAVGRVLMFNSPRAPAAAGSLAGGVPAECKAAGGPGSSDEDPLAAAAVAMPWASHPQRGLGGVSDTVKLQEQMQELTIQWNAMERRKGGREGGREGGR